MRIKNPMSHTPFSLAFVMEAIAPSKLVWPTTRIIKYDEDNNEQTQLIELDMREQRRGSKNARGKV